MGWPLAIATIAAAYLSSQSNDNGTSGTQTTETQKGAETYSGVKQGSEWEGKYWGGLTDEAQRQLNNVQSIANGINANWKDISLGSTDYNDLVDAVIEYGGWDDTAVNRERIGYLLNVDSDDLGTGMESMMEEDYEYQKEASEGFLDELAGMRTTGLSLGGNKIADMFFTKGNKDYMLAKAKLASKTEYTPNKAKIGFIEDLYDKYMDQEGLRGSSETTTAKLSKDSLISQLPYWAQLYESLDNISSEE